MIVGLGREEGKKEEKNERTEAGKVEKKRLEDGDQERGERKDA